MEFPLNRLPNAELPCYPYCGGVESSAQVPPSRGMLPFLLESSPTLGQVQPYFKQSQFTAVENLHFFLPFHPFNSASHKFYDLGPL